MTIRTTLSVSLATAAVAVAILAVSPVLAHARYKSSVPSAGEVLAASPARVEITFTEQIQKVSGAFSIDVGRDRGAAVTSGPSIIDDDDRTKLSVPLQPGLEPGRYVVNWKNTSDDDGDPAEGAFSFYINKQPNAVDLENDRQLTQIGFEDVTATAAAGGATPTMTSASTPAAGTTTAAGATRAPATTSAATTTPTISAAKGDEGGGDNTAIYVVVALAVAGAIAGLGAWRFLSGRRR